LGAVHAQETGNHVGEWRATYLTSGVETEANITITATGGEWHEFLGSGRRQKEFPCLGKTLPVTIKRSTPSELALPAEASVVAPGCLNHNIVVHPVDDNTLKGEFKVGKPIVMVRR
jgi:hypothetical protein